MFQILLLLYSKYFQVTEKGPKHAPNYDKKDIKKNNCVPGFF